MKWLVQSPKTAAVAFGTTTPATVIPVTYRFRQVDGVPVSGHRRKTLRYRACSPRVTPERPGSSPGAFRNQRPTLLNRKVGYCVVCAQQRHRGMTGGMTDRCASPPRKAVA
jgi:hypothetical protein